MRARAQANRRTRALKSVGTWSWLPAMRLAPTLLASLAVLLGLAFLPTAASGPFDIVGTPSQTFTAAPETSLRYYVPDDALVSFTVQVAQGTMHHVMVSGPNGCGGTYPVAAGTAVVVDCGWQHAGDGWVSLKVDGAAVGSVTLQGGAYFPPAG